MSYYHLKKPDILKNKLIDVFNLDPQAIFNLLEKVSSVKPNEFLGKLYQKTLDKEFLTNEIIKLIKDDFNSIKKDFDLNEFKIQYFFTLYHPIMKISCFSCELKNISGEGTIIYDIVRIGKYKDEIYLYLPQDDE